MEASAARNDRSLIINEFINRGALPHKKLNAMPIIESKKTTDKNYHDWSWVYEKNDSPKKEKGCLPSQIKSLNSSKEIYY